jgi:hypothetical protein
VSGTFDIGPGAPCVLDVLVDTRLLVQANSGGGKSWCLRRILEQTHGRVQHLVIDPEGEFSSLREKFDYVLAARHGGDTAADPRAAALLAEKLLELGVSAILDVYELKAHERVRFVRAFLDALVNAPKRLWRPALVVVDEAHVFCPQVGEAESAAAVIDLATRGRKRGFAAVLATQRLSKLHKDAAAECNNMLIGRTGMDIDMKRAADVLGLSGREDVHQLRTLEPGEFFAFGPAISQEVRRVRVGPTTTTHPKAGARIAFTAPPPTAKVRALLPQLADLPAEAEERAKSIEDLKRDNADLRRKLTLAEKEHPAPVPTVERVEVSVFTEDDLDVLRDFYHEIRDTRMLFEEQSGDISELLETAIERVTPPPRPAAPVGRPALRPAAVHARRPAEVRSNGASLVPAQQRIVNSLAFLEAIGIEAGSRVQVALLAEASPSSSGYANNLGALRTAGLIDYPREGQVALTEDGRARADTPDLTVDDLHKTLEKKLAPAQWRIVQMLIASYPDAVSREALAESVGASATSSGYANNLGALRTLGIIDYPQRGTVVALPVLFLESR